MNRERWRNNKLNMMQMQVVARQMGIEVQLVALQMGMKLWQ